MKRDFDNCANRIRAHHNASQHDIKIGNRCIHLCTVENVRPSSHKLSIVQQRSSKHIAHRVRLLVGHYGGKMGDCSAQPIDLYHANLSDKPKNTYLCRIACERGTIMFMYEKCSFASAYARALLYIHGAHIMHVYPSDDVSNAVGISMRRLSASLCGRYLRDDRSAQVSFAWMIPSLVQLAYARYVQTTAIRTRRCDVRTTTLYISDHFSNHRTHALHCGRESDADQKLQTLIDRIYAYAPMQFASRDAVEDVFMRAYFTGRIIPLAHVIDKALGIGTFHDLAQGSVCDETVDNHDDALRFSQCPAHVY